MNIKHMIKIILMIFILSISLKSIGRSCQDFQANLQILNWTPNTVSCTLRDTNNVRANNNYPSTFSVAPQSSSTPFAVGFMVASMGSESGLPVIHYICDVVDSKSGGGQQLLIALSATYTANSPFYPCTFNASLSANWTTSINDGLPSGVGATSHVDGASGATVTLNSTG